MSLGGKRHHAKQVTASQSTIELPQIERRWSVVGPGWNKKKLHSQYDDIPSGNTVQLSPIISLPALPTSSNQIELDLPIENSFSKVKRQSLQSFHGTNEEDFVRVPKIEYEAIKERVSAIENRISHEFGKVQSEMLLSENTDANNAASLENVLKKYEQTLEGTESMNSPSTDSLVLKMGKELKIRSAENKIIRSPSARKIGTMRRRSRENVRLSRNQSWHFGNKKPIATEVTNNQNQTEHLFYPKVGLKRGRPNTVQTGLRHPSPKESFLNGLQQSDLKIDENNFADALENENWVNGEQFFSSEQMQQPPVTPTRNIRNSMEGTPRFVSHLTLGEMKTPMLPPKRSVVPRTPATIAKASVRVSQRQSFINKPQSQQQPSVHEPQTGRASIARLRSQNAGMVAAKAKLFNGLVSEPMDLPNQRMRKPTESTLNKAQDKRENYRCADKSNSNSRKSTPRSTPRRNRNSHGINRRLKLRNALTPNKNSPRLSKRILENELVNRQIDRDNKFNNRFASRLKIASSPESSRVHHNRTHSKSPNKLNKNKKLTPVKLRSSPRLQIRNSSNQELMPYL